MKKVISASVLTLALLAGTNVMAREAEGTGDAKATLETGMQVEGKDVVDFGTLTRFGSGAGTVSLSTSGTLTDTDTIKGDGNATVGTVELTGAHDTVITDIQYGAATLSNGSGKTITMTVDGETTDKLDAEGKATLSVGGSLTLAGDEPDGEYSTEKADGVPYKVTVSY